MPNGETRAIMQAIAAVHSDVLKEIGELKNKIGQLTALHDRLEDIEDEQKSARNRQWLHSAVLLPLSVLVRGLAEHLGIRP